MSGEPSPPQTDPPTVRTVLSQMGDLLESLRERLARGGSVGVEPGPGLPGGRGRELLADRDEHALAIFQEILSVPPLALPPSELFGLAMDRVSRLLAADRTLLLVLDDATGRLVARSGRGFRRDDLEGVVVDPREGLVGRVFKEKRVLIYDAGAEPPGDDPFVERFPVRQAMAVPVRTEGEVGGVLFAGRRALGAPFTTTDVLLLLVIADRVGSALVHESLLDRRGDHLAHLRTLRSAVEGSPPGPEPRDVLARACEVGCRLVRVPAALAVVGAGPDALELVLGAGPLGSIETGRLRPLDPLLLEAYASDGPLAVRDLQARPGALPSVLQEEGLRGGLLVPIRSRGRPVGLLCLADSEVREFSSEEMESVQLLAALTAAALDTRRRRDDLRRSLEELRTDQERLVQSEKTRALAAMAAGLTRELNGVFAALVGKTQLLLGRAQDDLLREGLTVLEEAAWRGTDVLQRLLGLAEADRRDAEPVDLTAATHEAVAFTQPRWRDEPESRGARIELVADLAPTPPVAGSSRTALREAVTNLVLNAVDAMPAGGRLVVRTSGREGGAQLEVSDTGEGIADVIRSRIFDPFFTTRGPRHLGLGLCVVQAVVLRAGGRVRVAGGPGGTTATVWLPGAGERLPSRGSEAPEAAGRDEPAAGLEPSRPVERPAPVADRVASILVVEEEEDIRVTVVDALAAAGHGAETAADATAALTRLGHGGIDVVVTDLALRDRSGLQLARSVRDASPGTAVVLLTGWGHRLHADHVRESGVDVVLVKPVQPDRVRSAVAEALRLRSPA